MYNKACEITIIVDKTSKINLLTGKVFKKRGKVLQAAYIQNLTSGKNVFSDSDGNFSMEVKIDDKLRFSKSNLESITFTIINSTITYHINNNTPFEISLFKKNSKLGKN